jgi:hydrogenase small subunit
MKAEVVSGDHISLRYHPTVMTAQGDLAIKAQDDTYNAGPFALVIEGAVATKDNGIYNTVGEAHGVGIPMMETVKKITK